MQAEDILHPLATIDWQECPGSELPTTAKPIHVVTLNDKLYITVVTYQGGDCRHFIHRAPYDLTSWTVHTPPEGLEYFGLTSYHSQLLVVGGKERGEVTNKVWTSDNATDWHSSLPPMPNGRVSPLATNTGPSPECVVVAGRYDTNLTILDVLLEEQWFTVPTTLQRPKMYLERVAIQCGVVYMYIKASARPKNLLVTCPLESLLAACMQSHDKSHDKSHDLRLDVQVKPITLSTGNTDYFSFGQIVTCGQQLYILHHELMDVDNSLRTQVTCLNVRK